MEGARRLTVRLRQGYGGQTPRTIAERSQMEGRRLELPTSALRMLRQLAGISLTQQHITDVNDADVTVKKTC